MILTRIILNPLDHRIYGFIGRPYQLHQRLCHCFETSRKESEVLYRVEEGPVLLVQSAREGDWSRLELPATAMKCEPQSKPFSPELAIGQRLTFRLRCRPSVKKKIEGSKNSRLRYLRSDEERRAWLSRQGEKAGFWVKSVEVSQERWFDTKPGATETVPDRRRPDSYPATRFDGVLVVTDPDKLREAVRSGIGPQKAYGFGLLSLARCLE